MSITHGFEKARSFVRRAEPNVHAVWLVKPGKRRDLSIESIWSSSRGGIGMVGSEAMLEVTFREV